MTHKIISIFIIWITLAAVAGSEEFSKEKIRRFSGYVEIDAEVEDYIRSLPPNAIVDLVGELDFTPHKGWRNTTMFSFVLMKARQLDEDKTGYDRDWTFSRLADFIRILAVDGDSGDAGTMLLRVGNLKMFHPSILNVAEDLAAGDDERNAKRGRWLLDEHEKWQRTEARQHKRKSKEDNASAFSNNNRLAGDNTNSEAIGTDAGFRFWLLVFSLILLLAAGLFLSRRKARRGH